MKVGDRVRLVNSPFEPWDISLAPGQLGTVVRNASVVEVRVDFDGPEELLNVSLPPDCLELI